MRATPSAPRLETPGDSIMQHCELVDILTQPDWVIAIARVDNGYRCWIFTPEFTVLDDGEVHPSREAAANSARRLVTDSREY